jgi:hypothetical protein
MAAFLQSVWTCVPVTSVCMCACHNVCVLQRVCLMQAPLHNGLAVCHMKMGEWEDAERDLLEALGKDAKDQDTLANLVTVRKGSTVLYCRGRR